MKTFGQLIRLNEHRLHERQKAVTMLEAEASELKLKSDMLNAEALIEEARAEESHFGVAAFASYFVRVREKHLALTDARNAVARKILTARQELKRAFDELKRIEILRDQKRAEIDGAVKRAEQAELDEVALQQHRRNDSR